METAGCWGFGSNSFNFTGVLANLSTEPEESVHQQGAICSLFTTECASFELRVLAVTTTTITSLADLLDKDDCAKRVHF